MSRQKTPVKKQEWAGKPIIEKWQLATYGDRYDPRASMVLSLIGEALLLEEGFDALDKKGFNWPGVYNANDHAKAQEDHHWLAWRRLSELIKDCDKTGSGELLRKMGDILELNKKPVNRAQALVGRMLQAIKDQKLVAPTIPQVQEYLAAWGEKTSYNQIKRILGYFEFKAAKGKMGAPKGPRRKV